MIGLIGAMEAETAAIKAELTHTTEETLSGIRFVRGFWGEKEIVVATCGIGKVFAALCAQTMILKYDPDCIINCGVAGGLHPNYCLLDVVLAKDVVQHDMDTSPIGDPKGLISGINKIQLPADEALTATLKTAAEGLGCTVHLGRIASGDQFIADESTKTAIRADFSADCCEMEGAAIGQVCYVNQVPFAILRTLSDGAGSDAQMDYPTFAAKAATQSIAILRAFVLAK
ncbi:MAG: 5'-methylthioadenosine/adenosylhomocysteine nucleosidase [Clostridia bacterium]|nr:5'-methylthioadenosine/adenosylhomocysteine nucleosidase [Clostridia bacterium]